MTEDKSSENARGAGGAGGGWIFTAVGAAVAICLYTFGHVPWIVATLIGAAWPLALLVVLAILLYKLVVMIFAWLVVAVIAFFLLVISYIMWEGVQNKRLVCGRHLPKFISSKVRQCIDSERKLFGDVSPDSLDGALHGIHQPVEICKRISKASDKVMRGDAEPWKGFSGMLVKLSSTHRADLRHSVETIVDARRSLSDVLLSTRWQDMPDAGKAIAEPGSELHEKACQYLRSAGEAWKRYVAEWNALLANYNSGQLTSGSTTAPNAQYAAKPTVAVTPKSIPPASHEPLVMAPLTTELSAPPPPAPPPAAVATSTRAVHQIVFKCSCGKSLKASPEKAGRRTQCPACKQILRIPII